MDFVYVERTNFRFQKENGWKTRQPTSQIFIQTPSLLLIFRPTNPMTTLRNHPFPPNYSRGEWFWRKCFYSFYVVPNCFRTPIPKCHVWMLPFPWLQAGLGIRSFAQLLFCSKLLTLKSNREQWALCSHCSLKKSDCEQITLAAP